MWVLLLKAIALFDTLKLLAGCTNKSKRTIAFENKISKVLGKTLSRDTKESPSQSWGSLRRWDIVRSANRCRHCILGLLYFYTYLGLEFKNSTRNFGLDSCGLYNVHILYTNNCVTFWDSSFELADYIKSKYNDDISLLISEYLISGKRRITSAPWGHLKNEVKMISYSIGIGFI
jgi:hypothetical protein